MAKDKAPDKLAKEINDAAIYLWHSACTSDQNVSMLQAWVQLKIEQMRKEG